MFMSAMVQIFSWGERWNVPFNEAKPSWMERFIFHQMKIFVPLYEWKNIHYLFYITSKVTLDSCDLTGGYLYKNLYSRIKIHLYSDQLSELIKSQNSNKVFFKSYNCQTKTSLHQDKICSRPTVDKIKCHRPIEM